MDLLVASDLTYVCFSEPKMKYKHFMKSGFPYLLEYSSKQLLQMSNRNLAVKEDEDYLHVACLWLKKGREWAKSNINMEQFCSPWAIFDKSAPLTLFPLTSLRKQYTTC